jgi:uncharacterized protein (TIGR02453 family)
MEKINLEPVLAYLNDLSNHNDKTWFEQNRQVYEAARNEFLRFTDAIIDEFRVVDDLQDLTAKDCISRIYRDLRFSKDKTPYHTNMWATIAPGGKHTKLLGYHVAIQPQGGSMLAGGLYEPTTEQITRFRQAIDRNSLRFKLIIHDQDLLDYFGGIEGERLKTAPQGYDRSNPEIELLQLKQVVVIRYFTDEQVLADGFLAQLIKGCQAMRPFLDYLDEML